MKNKTKTNFIALSFLIFLASFFACDSGEGQVNEDADQKIGGAPQWTLAWSDEFNGQGLPDANNWTYDLGDACDLPMGCGWGNDEVQAYTKDLRNVRQENGKLIIEAVKDENGQWTSARLKTQGLQSFTYGRISFKAKLPAGVGTWAALWMLGTNIDEVGWPQCGEIDIMEYVGREEDQVSCALHVPSSYNQPDHVGKRYVNDVTGSFHEYSIDWSPEKISFLVDGNLYYEYNPTLKDDGFYPFNHDLYIIMNIAMGGYLGNEPSLATPGKKDGIDPELTSAKMEIDYVRVYQKQG